MVEATRHGAGSALVLLAGEDGLGKSTLVEALAAGFQGQVTIGRAQPFAATGLVHAAIAGVLKQLARQVASADLRRWAGANAPALAALLPELGEPVHDRLRLFEAVTAVLEGAAAREPLLVVIEDAQWIDESSSHLIRFLHTSLGAAAVTLLVTFRAKELSLRDRKSVV